MENPNGVDLRRAKVLPPTPENIQIVAQAILNDEVVGMPTETVYGLAGRSHSPLALARIFETKERPTFDPLIVHIGPLTEGVSELEKLRLVEFSKTGNLQNSASDPNFRLNFGLQLDLVKAQIDRLIKEFWPGPLTLVLPKHSDIPDLATSGHPTVAIRMPRHPVAQLLIAACKSPLAAPSANRFGRISPTTSSAVSDELGDRIQWILEGGPCQIGLESTILGLNGLNDWTILRHGGTPAEEIEKVLGFPLKVFQNQAHRSSLQASTPIVAPGMLESHYAPSKALHLLPRPVELLTEEDFKVLQAKAGVKNAGIQAHSGQNLKKVGLLLLAGDPKKLSDLFSHQIGCSVEVRSLSLTGNLQEAAHRLFAEMRHLDGQDTALIFSEVPVSNQGLAYAIRDRLKRASAPRTS